ncbi:hypothetical protein BGZ60DRAFT_196085 [Tricladium varicosporioides]|nr:hypothetical protein BGZ60DRAFT_196085 [Hymenoscyphus varicosporioides]
MWGSTVPSIYYGFYCDSNLQRLYWAIVSVLAVACAAAILAPRFQHPNFDEIQNHRMGLNYMLTMAMFNLLGAAIYTTRIPEKCYQPSGISFHSYLCWSSTHVWIAKCFRLYSLADSVLHLKTALHNYT